jgi:UDP-N-acetylglucosamine/UDP-N-acetylgalactosamine diphosphorylase
LAGGQGSRLGYSQPKALVPITPVRQKTLLQLFCEKTKAASLAYGLPLQMAVMASPLNFDILQSYLKENDYFGLAPSQVHLFSQDTAPLLNEEGDWFLENGVLATGPNGNGYSLHKLMESGIGKQWKEQGIESVMALPIDNPLADPFDAAFCGFHHRRQNEATLKAIERKDKHEKVGVIVRKQNRIAVQEYSEIPSDFEAPLAHINLFCFSLAFIEKMPAVDLPWHLAHKKHGSRMVWKFEKFLFDVLTHTEKTGILVYPREDVYAPLKNLEGPHSVETVRRSLADFDRRLLSGLVQMPLPSHLFELDPAFYYPTPGLKKQWQGKKAPDSNYIVPELEHS